MTILLGSLPVLAYLPGLACLAMVFVCGRMLFGGHHEPDRGDEIAQLREEVAQLRAEREATKPEDAVHE